MKTTVLVLAAVLFNILSAQDKFATYENEFASEEYDIEISLKENENFTLYIRALSMDPTSDVGGFLVTAKQHEDFVRGLNEAKVKFTEWKNIAVQNKVTDLNKTMEIKTKSSGFFLYGKKWKFDYSVKLDFDFKVVQTGDLVEHILIVRTGEMIASDNQYMDTKGAVLVFTTAEQITEFVEMISLENINKFRNQPKTEDLFKN